MNTLLIDSRVNAAVSIAKLAVRIEILDHLIKYYHALIGGTDKMLEYVHEWHALTTQMENEANELAHADQWEEADVERQMVADAGFTEDAYAEFHAQEWAGLLD